MFFRNNKIIFLNIKFFQQDFILGKEKRNINTHTHACSVIKTPVNAFFLWEDFHQSYVQYVVS